MCIRDSDGLGHSFLESHSLNEALEHFRCCVKIYDTIKANSISEDQLKISFCTRNQCAYTDLWQVLVILQRNDEALYAAERGRAQALLDACLKSNLWPYITFSQVN